MWGGWGGWEGGEGGGGVGRRYGVPPMQGDEKGLPNFFAVRELPFPDRISTVPQVSDLRHISPRHAVCDNTPSSSMRQVKAIELYYFFLSPTAPLPLPLPLCWKQCALRRHVVTRMKVKKRISTAMCQIEAIMGTRPHAWIRMYQGKVVFRTTALYLMRSDRPRVESLSSKGPSWKWARGKTGGSSC